MPAPGLKPRPDRAPAGADNAAIETAIGYRFEEPALLLQALTHASFIAKVSERPRAGYERLEFLGDRVLGLVVAALLFRQHPDLKEGQLAARFAELVRGNACAEVAEAWGLTPAIRAAPAEGNAQDPVTTSVKSDVCEAVIGAVFLDGGYEAARGVVEAAWRPRLASPPDLPPDAKSALQEWTQGHALPMPRYEVRARAGSDHLPRFSVAVEIAGFAAEVGHGTSKREAQQEAARLFLIRENIWRAPRAAMEAPPA